MLVSTILTTGQVTFILRVAITILSSGGLFLVGLIVLGNAPRIASVTTHDTISRISGSQTATSAALKWVLKRGKTSDPTSTSKLTLGIILLLSYSLFVKLSDIGLIGLHTCTTRAPDFIDSPASVRDDNDIRTVLQTNMVNGSNPAITKYFRCDAVEPFVLNANDTLSACTAWTNSTYADKSVFKGLNTSDTAVLMPRQLTRYTYPQSDVFELNGYFLGTLYQRVSDPTIMNGLALVPHDTGFRAFLGIPNLAPYTRISLPQTLALEADMGCMTVGMYTQSNVYDFSIDALDAFATEPNGTWRQYAGPDYLRDTISRTVDEVRDYLKPMWNMSTLNTTSHIVFGLNASAITPDSAASVRSYFLPSLPDGSFGSNVDANRAVFGNCSERVEARLNISTPGGFEDGVSCGMMGIGGSIMQDGELFVGLSRMVCATAVQVNLVRADIEVDGDGKLNVTFERLPSDLHSTKADWWNAHPVGNDTQYDKFDPLYRYALTPNPVGSTNHYIRPTNSLGGHYEHGPGGGANSFPLVGRFMLNDDGTLAFKDQYASLAYLQEEYRALNLTPARVTKWAGALGSSYILGSSAFNPWAANSLFQAAPITVVSTGGKAATCYNPPYGIAFIPLVLAAIVALFMSLGMLFTSTLFKASRMKEFYAGLQPYTSVLLPNSAQLQTLLVWEDYGQPRLEPVQNGQTIEEVGGKESAVGHLHR